MKVSRTIVRLLISILVVAAVCLGFWLTLWAYDKWNDPTDPTFCPSSKVYYDTDRKEKRCGVRWN
ncbi:hypothetical protein OKW42_004479 [Paraburkholderia sp. WC7.3d]